MEDIIVIEGYITHISYNKMSIIVDDENVNVVIDHFMDMDMHTFQQGNSVRVYGYPSRLYPINDVMSITATKMISLSS